MSDEREVRMVVEVCSIKESIDCGLRQEWVEQADGDGYEEVSVACGAGLGTPWIILHGRLDGEEFDARIHVESVLDAVKAAVRDHRASANSTQPSPEAS